MKQIAHDKADYFPLFRSTLIESTGKILVESTQDLFWTSGLPPVFSDTTKPEYDPGRNHLAQVLNSVRKDLVREATISALIDVDSNYDVVFPSSPQTITPDDIHTSSSPPSPPIVPVDDHISSDMTVDHLKKLPPPLSPFTLQPPPTESLNSPSDKTSAPDTSSTGTEISIHIAGPSRSTRRENRAQSRNVLHVNTRNAGIDKHKSDTTPVSKQETLSITLDANAKRKLSPEKRSG